MLRTALFEPFEILRYSNRESSRKEKETEGSRDVEIWLRRSRILEGFAELGTISALNFGDRPGGLWHVL